MTDEALISIVPGLLWFALAVAIVGLFWRQLATIADITVQRIRDGAPFAFGSVVNVGVVPEALRTGQARTATAEGPDGADVPEEAEQAVSDATRLPLDLSEQIYLVHATQVLVPHTAASRGSFRVRVTVEADPPTLLDDVKRVTYRLHPSFKRRVISTTARKESFELWMTIWGEFTIVAYVEHLSKPPVWLTRYIDLPGRPPD